MGKQQSASPTRLRAIVYTSTATTPIRMRPSTSLLPLAAKRPKTIASKRICCHLQQRYASTSKDVPLAPGSTEAETKKNEANYKRMQMMRDPPNLTAAAVGVFAHYIKPIKRKPAHPEGSYKRKI